MTFQDLAVAVLQQVGAVCRAARPGLPPVIEGAMAVLDLDTMPAGLDAVDRHALVVEGRDGNKPNGVGGRPADAGDQRGRAAGPSNSSICFAPSRRPMMDWKSRTMAGVGGAGPPARADDVVGGCARLVTQSRAGASFMGVPSGVAAATGRDGR